MQDSCVAVKAPLFKPISELPEIYICGGCKAGSLFQHRCQDENCQCPRCHGTGLSRQAEYEDAGGD